MKVALTGASGFLGSALCRSWQADGHAVVRLVRRSPASADEARWDPDAGTVQAGALDGVDAVVHLASAGPGDRPWTPGYRRTVLGSRVTGTATIARAVAEAGVPTLLSASGTGYYGNPGDLERDESAPAGDTGLADIVKQWERAAQPADASGTRLVLLRTGVVLSASGGAYQRRLLPLFRLGLGGRLGSGRQWWSWVALEDYVRAVRFLAERTDLTGPVNVTSPEPLRNAEMTAAMGRVLRRPTVMVAPGFALGLALGDFGRDLVGGQRVLPRRLLDAGFSFERPSFEPALRRSLAEGRS